MVEELSMLSSVINADVQFYSPAGKRTVNPGPTARFQSEQSASNASRTSSDTLLPCIFALTLAL
jgi:hypothetical protein